MRARINRYLRAVAPLGREAEQVGPFLATCDPTTDNPFLNYAMPDDAAAPTTEDVAALIRWFQRRSRTPRLEYVADLAPAVEAALITADFAVEGRLPLMVWEPTRSAPPPKRSDIEVIVPTSDEDLLGMSHVQAEAYGAPPPSRTEIRRRRTALENGSIAVIARDVMTSVVVGAGSCSPIIDGVTEVAAIGVAPTHRRRGIAQTLAHRIAIEALARGAQTLFLMAAHDAEERIYDRAGFNTVGKILHISCRPL